MVWTCLIALYGQYRHKKQAFLYFNRTDYIITKLKNKGNLLIYHIYFLHQGFETYHQKVRLAWHANHSYSLNESHGHRPILMHQRVAIFDTRFFGSLPKIVKNLATLRLLRKPQPYMDTSRFASTNDFRFFGYDCYWRL